MTYDYLDRLETKTYSKHIGDLDFQMQSIVYAYDGNSNIKSITEVKKLAGADVTETTIQTYDPLDRVQTNTHQDYDDSSGKKIEYDYDIQGNRTAVIDPDGIKTAYTYDARNRLSTATTEADLPTAAQTTYTWWEDSLLKRVEYPNGTLQDRSSQGAYDRADRIMLIQNRPVNTNQPVFSQYEYTYDENGNRLTQFETQSAFSSTSELTSYSYDNLNRLSHVIYGPIANPVGDISYSSAPNGNRLSEEGIDPHTGQPIDRLYQYRQILGKEAVTFNNVNSLSRIVDNLDSTQNIVYEYDTNLNQVAKEKGGVRDEFQFGIRDQILSANVNGNPVLFDYDHSRMRVKKINGGVGSETRYLYDQSSVLQEYDGTDANLSTFHKYDYGYDLLSLTDVNLNGLIRERRFYLTDGLMSTANLTEESGGLIHSYRYDAWGRTREEVGTSDNPRQYTGHYKDPAGPAPPLYRQTALGC